MDINPRIYKLSKKFILFQVIFDGKSFPFLIKFNKKFCDAETLWKLSYFLCKLIQCHLLFQTVYVCQTLFIFLSRFLFCSLFAI